MEENTTSQVVREIGENYEVLLEDTTCLLDRCWYGLETATIDCAKGEPVKCSSMAERAVWKMLQKLGIDIEERRVKLDPSEVHYLVRLARDGTNAWKDVKQKFSVEEQIVERAREETFEELRKEYSNHTGEVQISCTDGIVSVHQGVADRLKAVALSGTHTRRLPISQRQCSIITDLVYFGKTSFKLCELAAVYVASTFCNLKKVLSLGDELRHIISKDWKSAFAVDSIGTLSSVSMTILCSRDDFVGGEHEPEISASLEKWAGLSRARRSVKDRLLTLLQMNSASDRVKDYSKFIYYNGHKFDGTLWTVSELHEESSKRFTHTNAVINPEGDRIVSSRPGPIGILSTGKGFTESDYHLPHDPLGYGHPYTFQHFPFVCLVFNIYDSKSKHFGTELWQWKEQATFEPIKTSPMWGNVGNMVRVNDDLFYLTGRRSVCDVGDDNVSGDASLDGEDRPDKDEAGLYLMSLKRVDGVLHGDVTMIERWSLDEYAEKFTIEFFCIGETLYRQERDFDFREHESSPTVLSRFEEGKFVPADNLQPVKGAMLQTWTLESRTFAVASLYDESNCSCPCGFFELTDGNVWRDRTLETGFFNVCPKWKPANDCAWCDFDTESV